MREYYTQSRKKPPTNGQKRESGLVPFPLSKIKPSPENDKLYRQTDPNGADNAEIEAERKDARFLAGVWETVKDVLQDIDFDMEGAA
ncbi:hypothetical protein [Bythopirellula goksoeyrii]|uniref:Uncharacterized protein n=1 Tax=Bythopirellula goksoeyrii TaxID=1400387 RepID=A0A5B9QDV1_9BACT|nr:hypothetical protein [Bythopirellula goksoeyrii]QEG35116.1 hypothetical protein Pr1d_24070 [Bythopirellula goksoeyrii]